MAIKFGSTQAIKKYFDGVVERANDHAPEVNEVIFTLLSGVLWKSTGIIQVREYNGNPANILWMYVNSHRVCFTYNHHTRQIDAKEGSHRGLLIRSFDNHTIHSDIIIFFKGL